MKSHIFNNYKLYRSYTTLILFFAFIYCQNDTNNTNTTNSTTIISDEENSFEAKCIGRSLNYPILVNLSKYLEILSKNESEIENNTVISSLKDATTIGVMEGTIYEHIIEQLNISNVITYDSYDEIEIGLKHHIIDAFLASKYFADLTIMNHDDLKCFDFTENDSIIQYKLFINNKDIQNHLNHIIDNNLDELIKIWFGHDTNYKNINKILTGHRGNLSIALNFNEVPFSFKGPDGELTGLTIDLIYRLANSSGYQVEFIEAETFEDLIDIIENDNTTDISGLLALKEIYEDKNNVKILFDNIRSMVVIRYENTNESKYWKEPYTSFEQFNKDTLGSLNDSSLELTKQNFNESEIIIRDNINDLYNSLLLKEIDGFLVDEDVAKYYANNIDNRFTYLNKTLARNNFGFIFNNEDILNQFNEYIFELKNKTNGSFLNDIEVNDTIYEIIKNITNVTEELIINIIVVNDIKPLAYYENGEYKGYEVVLLCNFAYSYNYSIIFNNDSETNNVYIGYQKISRSNLGNFSDSIYYSNIVLATRKEKLKDTFEIKILDQKYREKNNNNILIPIKFSHISKTVSCSLPTKYDYILLLQCIITGIYYRNQFRGEYQYGETQNKIKLMYKIISANNLLNANDIFPDEYIVNHSNLTDVICPENKTTSNKTKESSDTFKISTASIIALGIIGLILIAAIITFIFMYNKEIGVPSATSSNKVEFENTSSNLD